MSQPWIDRTVRMAIYHRDGFRCVYCFQPRLKAYNGKNLTLDHIVPRSQGGSDLPTNLVTACRSCNHAIPQLGGGYVERPHSEDVMLRLQRHLDRPLNLEVGKVLRAIGKLASPAPVSPDLEDYLEQSARCSGCGGIHPTLECPHRPETD